jgi:hypothetical protein
MSLPDRTETRDFFPLVSACGFAWRVLRRVRREDLVHAVHVYQLVLQPRALLRQPPQQVTFLRTKAGAASAKMCPKRLGRRPH